MISSQGFKDPDTFSMQFILNLRSLTKMTRKLSKWKTQGTVLLEPNLVTEEIMKTEDIIIYETYEVIRSRSSSDNTRYGPEGILQRVFRGI